MTTENAAPLVTISCDAYEFRVHMEMLAGLVGNDGMTPTERAVAAEEYRQTGGRPMRGADA